MIQNGLVPHRVWQLRIGKDNWVVEVPLRSKGSQSNTGLPSPEHQCLGEESPSCEKQWGFHLDETEAAINQAQTHSQPLSLRSSDGTATQKDQGPMRRTKLPSFMARAGTTALSKAKVFSGTTVPLSSPP